MAGDGGYKVGMAQLRQRPLGAHIPDGAGTMSVGEALTLAHQINERARQKRHRDLWVFAFLVVLLVVTSVALLVALIR